MVEIGLVAPTSYHPMNVRRHAWQKQVRYLNTLRPRQNGRHFADDIFEYIFLMTMFEFW